MRLTRWLGGWVELVLPALCRGCSEPLGGDERPLCRRCADDLVPMPTPRCPRCAAPLARPELCLPCRDAPPPQAATVVLGEYRGLLRKAVLALKHGGCDELSAPLGDALGALVAATPAITDVAVVTAVPSRYVLRMRRGWVAAELLAKRVAAVIDAPYRSLLRRRGRRRQAERSRAERTRLPASSFVARAPIDGGTVLLVDDVRTTGATLQRASAALLNGGADAVCCAAVGWTPDPRRTV